MLKASDIMTKDVVTIRGSDTVAAAVELMKEKGLRALLVEPRYEHDPYGMVTETDIIYKVAAYGHDPKQMRVYEIMTKPCVVVNPDLGVEYVARLFAQTRIRRAPVIQGKLLGIISISDILHKSDFVEKPRPMFIEERIESAREEARAICKEKGDTAPECAAAWDVVEELQMAAADQRKENTEPPTSASQPSQTSVSKSFQQYCEENPDADECRIYED